MNTKLPKKIYLNYCDENCDSNNDEDLSGITWYSEHITVSDCVKSHEYTDLSQVWHDASEIPQENNKHIIHQSNYYSTYNVHIAFIPMCLRSCKITSRSWDEFVKNVNMRRWAYISDLLPKKEEL